MKFHIKDAYIREGKLIASDKNVVEIEWKDMVKRFLPEKSKSGLAILSIVKSGSFIGVLNRCGKRSLFMFDTAGKSNSIEHIMKSHHNFGSLDDVCFVTKVTRDSSLIGQ